MCIYRWTFRRTMTDWLMKKCALGSAGRGRRCVNGLNTKEQRSFCFRIHLTHLPVPSCFLYANTRLECHVGGLQLVSTSRIGAPSLATLMTVLARSLWRNSICCAHCMHPQSTSCFVRTFGPNGICRKNVASFRLRLFVLYHYMLILLERHNPPL